MRTKMKITMLAVALGVGISMGVILTEPASGTGISQPGTTDDPVVTKSYVDQQIQQALNGGGGSSVNPTNPTTPINPENPSNPAQPSQGADEVKNVALKPGKLLIADAGTEFIVRSGHAVIYTEVASGVADLTDGKDLLNGQAAPKNHLLSFPREGRGIQVKEGSQSNLIVMVRGGYTIK